MHGVLLAEDEPVSRCFLQEALQALGHACDAVADGEEAVARAMASAYALLLFDRELPSLRGDLALARIRTAPQAASRRTPAVALTADTDPAVHRALRDAGFAAVGCKPLTLAALDTLLAPLLPVPCGWNEAQGLAACGGDRNTLHTLRGLMLAELPGQLRDIGAAIGAGEQARARAVLHRLRAACGFCGASALAARVDALHAAPADAGARLAFEQEAAQLLGAPAPPRGNGTRS
jgi:CheY-like chemotaxis protein